MRSIHLIDESIMVASRLTGSGLPTTIFSQIKPSLPGFFKLFSMAATVMPLPD